MAHLSGKRGLVRFFQIFRDGCGPDVLTVFPAFGSEILACMIDPGTVGKLHLYPRNVASAGCQRRFFHDDSAYQRCTNLLSGYFQGPNPQTKPDPRADGSGIRLASSMLWQAFPHASTTVDRVVTKPGWRCPCKPACQTQLAADFLDNLRLSPGACCAVLNTCVWGLAGVRQAEDEAEACQGRSPPDGPVDNICLPSTTRHCGDPKSSSRPGRRRCHELCICRPE